MSLQQLLSLLILFLVYTDSLFLFHRLKVDTAPPSAPLNLTLYPTPTDTPFGTRLFLTGHANRLNLVWCCDVREGADKTAFEVQTTVQWWYDKVGDGSTVRNAGDKTQVTSRYKASNNSDGTTWLLGQYNSTLELLFNKTLSYKVSCNGAESREFEILYRYWDNDQGNKHPWAVLSVGSVGLYNTSKYSLHTLETISHNVKNVLWTIPGGLIEDYTASDKNDNVTLANAVSWSRWLVWIQLVQNVTCCIPVVASPSMMDLYPYDTQNQLQSNFRHFMELPFVSKSHEVLWYSFDHRNLHVVSVCTYCDLSDDSEQFQWLEEDLKAAHKTNKTHWTMVLGHDPIYHSDESLHPEVATKARVQLDKLFDRYDVDFAVWSHERWYERTKPMRNFTVTDERTSNTLLSVNGTIHYTCGTGGIPLQSYNMDKYKHSARFLAKEYGVCSFHRISDNEYDTTFLYSNGSHIETYDVLKIKKDIPQRAPVNYENQFSRFMKVFGIVLVIGAVVMLLVTVAIKAVQKHDPSFITNKIRNIRYRKEASPLGGSSERVEIEMDAPDLPSTNGDKVMLLDEEDNPTPEFSSAAHMYGVMM